MTAAGPVGVAGASARAAAGSLRRAGFAAWAVDLFADRDLRRVAACARCPLDHYPDAIPGLCDGFPPGPVLYTGGLENHPEVVRELARRRPLWGNGPGVLDRVRDPFRLYAALATEFPVPRLVPPGGAVPGEGRWLRKPRGSSAGFGIRPARAGEVVPGTHYVQEFIDGPALSAVFTDAGLFGVSEQLAGVPWLHAGEFAYAGSVATEPSPLLSNDLRRLGRALATAFDLCGVWNVDFILRDGVPYPVEVNPRYSASVEVLELANGTAVFNARAGNRTTARSVGKGVYFAPHRHSLPPAGPWDADLAGDFDPWRVPGFADIPDPGEVTEAGAPVVTIFATGSTPADCRAKLVDRAARLDQLFAEQRP